MPVDDTQEIWSRFTEFECAVGDLSSLIKVEKRRGTALREVTNALFGNCMLLCVCKGAKRQLGSIVGRSLQIFESLSLYKHRAIVNGIPCKLILFLKHLLFCVL